MCDPGFNSNGLRCRDKRLDHSALARSMAIQLLVDYSVRLIHLHLKCNFVFTSCSVCLNKMATKCKSLTLHKTLVALVIGQKL